MNGTNPLSSLARLILVFTFFMPFGAAAPAASSAQLAAPLSRSPAAELDAQSPYQEWLEVSTLPDGRFSSVLPYQGLIYASRAQRITVNEAIDLNSLEQVGESTPLNQTPSALLGKNGYLYAITPSEPAALMVFSLADPRQPTLVSSLAIGSGARSLLPTGSGLVVAYSNKLQLINLSSPDAPLAGKVINVNLTGLPAVDGSHFYFASGKEVYWIDLAAPTPTAAAILTSSGYIDTLAVRGALGLVYTSGELRVLDLSSPGSPQALSTMEIATLPRTIAFNGPYAYMGAGAKVLVLNLADPIQPKLLSSRVLFSEGSGINARLIADSSRLYYWDIERGIAVLNLNQPAAPTLAAFWPNRSFTRLAHDGGYLYAATNRGSLAVYDLRDPDHPVLHAELPTGGFISSLAVRSGLAAAAGKYSLFVDVSDPANPVELSRMNLNIHEITLEGGHAFASKYDELLIISLADPRSPQISASIPSPGWNSNLLVRDNLLYAANESSKTLNIYSLANLASPTLLVSFPIDFGGSFSNPPNGLAFYQQYVLVQSTYSLMVVDVSNPASPARVSTLDRVGSVPGASVVVGDQVLVGDFNYIKAVSLADPFNPKAYSRDDLNRWARFSGVWAKERLYLAANDLVVLRQLPAVVKHIESNFDQPSNLISPQDRVSYSLPPNSFYSSGYFFHVMLDKMISPPTPTNLRGVGGVFRNSRSSGSGNQSYQISLAYNESQVSGLDENSLKLYFWNGSAWAAEPSSQVNATNNTLTAAPQKTGLWMAAAPPLSQLPRYSMMLPLVARSKAIEQNLDLVLTGIEVTQGVQNAANTLPLVQNRPAVMRIYARTNQVGGTRGVMISIAAARGGEALPGSPIISGPWTLQTSSSRGIFENSPYVRLPQDWLHGEVALTVDLDSANQHQESSESNNSLTQQIAFQYVPPLHVVVVPVRYTHLPTGQVFEPISEDLISWYNMDLFPVHWQTVEMHAPVNFSGSLPTFSSWTSLLNLITALKNSEGRAPGIVYYGVVPEFPVPPFSTGGVGWLGVRASTGFNNSRIMAHEIGHNFGLDHTFAHSYPYPYMDGRIGEFGFDVTSGAVHHPYGISDIMSYEPDQWISDYHYLRIYEDQRARGAVFLNETPEQAVMLVSGSADDEGAVNLNPVYLLPETAPSLAQQGGLYQVVLIDADGREAARYPLEVYWTEEESEDHHHETQGRFDARLPLPDQPLSAVQIYKGETLVAERKLDPPDLSKMALQSSLTLLGVELTWDGGGKPALLQASQDGGQNWQTLAVDVSAGSFSIDAEWLQGHTVLFRALIADQASFNPGQALQTEVDFRR